MVLSIMKAMIDVGRFIYEVCPTRRVEIVGNLREKLDVMTITFFLKEKEPMNCRNAIIGHLSERVLDNISFKFEYDKKINAVVLSVTMKADVVMEPDLAIGHCINSVARLMVMDTAHVFESVFYDVVTKIKWDECTWH
ncbi:MAG: hypothetical protein ACTSRA_00140 [Promethearchaeota archaeon]|nr:MAG: hypothetical protein [Helarchaeota virus Nidhogg Meg22_1012]URC17365.1 MAG: hypothetical protein [Helarchaeota virus Nidhogg Meg22_1214]